MGRIIELSQAVANQIAAGEVVERPASVVKELVENSLDAGAQDIEVRIKEGGFGHIMVQDDGVGMDAEDLKLAIKRYATSKLETVSDLNTLRTFGFRGEALPSIASVSHMSIASKTRHQDYGVTALIEAGTIRDISQSQTPAGTRVLVRDLFFNVPARLKFARSKRAEVLEIDRLLRCFAFQYPKISWKFFNDNHLVFTYGNEEQGSIKRAVGLLGKDVEGHLFFIESVSDLLTLTGVLGSPLIARRDMRTMFFFVNHRLVSDKKLIIAIKNAFHSLLEVGRHPHGALNIEIAPDLVDVNVHPRKAEVRFFDERRVMAHVIAMVQEALAKTPWLTKTNHEPLTNFSGAAPFKASADISYLLSPKKVEPQNLSLNMVISDDRLIATKTSFTQTSLLAAKKFSDLRVVGQIFATYLLAESDDSFIVIDQHAAHERVMYEKLRHQGSQKLASQPLLVPYTVTLPYPQIMMVEEHRKDFDDMGIEVDLFGEDTVVIRALPDFLKHSDIKALLRDMLNDFSAIGQTFLPENLFLRLVATIACHGSIRAGQRLSHDEISSLLVELDDTDFRAHCPHGRPIVKSFPKDEMKRWFDRT